MRSLFTVVTLVAALLATSWACADEPPLPRGAVLRGTVEADGIRELPDLKGARINRMRDESVRGVRVLDQTWQCDDGYAEAVRFYNRSFGGGDALVIEREQADTATGWLVRLGGGTLASVTARNTRPTTIEIQRVVP